MKHKFDEWWSGYAERQGFTDKDMAMGYCYDAWCAALKAVQPTTNGNAAALVIKMIGGYHQWCRDRCCVATTGGLEDYCLERLNALQK